MLIFRFFLELYKKLITDIRKNAGSFRISWSTKIEMKTSLISFSSLFLKSQFSTSTSIAPKSSTSSKLFCDEKDVPIERYVSGPNECVLLNTPNFCGCESVCHDVSILAVNKSEPLNTDAKVKQLVFDLQVATVCLHTLCLLQ